MPATIAKLRGIGRRFVEKRNATVKKDIALETAPHADSTFTTSMRRNFPNRLENCFWGHSASPQLRQRSNVYRHGWLRSN